MLEQLENITKLSNNVTRILGQNPSQFTLQGTNTYLIGEEQKRILIDTGQGNDDYKKIMLEFLSNEKCFITDILITHSHIDHIGGINQILDINKQLSGKQKINIYKFQNNIETLQLDNKSQLTIYNIINNKLQVLYCPGHTIDHCAFYFEIEKSLFCGDLVLGEGDTTVIQNLEQYLDSLEYLIQFIKDNQIQKLYCGHGTEIQGQQPILALFNKFYEHKLLREQQIFDSIKNCTYKATIQYILQNVYPDLQEQLKLGAIGNIVAHTNMLIASNKIIKINDMEEYFELYNKSSKI